MKQNAFVIELLADGEKTYYVMRLTNGQALACAGSVDDLHKKIDSFLDEFEKTAPVKE